MALFAGHEFRSFDRVSLQELVQPAGVTPSAAKVVVSEFAAFEFADNRIPPVAKLDTAARFCGAIQLERAVNRFVEFQSMARQFDRGKVTDFGLDLYYV